MIVECPNCEARFRVSEEALGPAGRQVRCGDCGHIWHAAPDGGALPRADDGHASPAADQPPDTPVPDRGEEAAGEAPPPGEEAEAPAVAEQDGAAADDPIAAPMTRLREAPQGDGPGLASQRERRRGGPSWLAIGWIAWGVFVLAILAGGWTLRTELQTAWPPSRALYAALGLAESPSADTARARPSPEDAFEVRIDSNPEWQALEDGWRVIVSGSVVNTAREPVALGVLTLALVDDSGTVLTRAPVTFERDALAPGERLVFRKAIEDAPAQTTGILYEWDERG